MKYTELIQIWKQSKEEFRNYEWNTAVIAAKVYTILREKFELSNENLFKLVDPDETNHEKILKTMYSHMGATKLDEKGWAKFGMFLTLELAENTFPKEPILFISYVKITTEKILLKATLDSEPQELNIEFNDDDKNKIEGIYDSLLDLHIKNKFSNWLNSI